MGFLNVNYTALSLLVGQGNRLIVGGSAGGETALAGFTPNGVLATAARQPR